jgi:MFS family permease
MGFIFPAVIFTQAAGPIIAGAIIDAIGTYRPAFVILASVSIVGLLSAVLAYPPKPHEGLKTKEA